MILRSPALSVLSSLFSFELGMMSSVAVWPRFSPVAAFLGHGFPVEAVVCRGVCRFGECGGRSRSLSLFWGGTGSLSAKLLSETFVRGAGSIALRPMFNELSARMLTGVFVLSGLSNTSKAFLLKSCQFRLVSRALRSEAVIKLLQHCLVKMTGKGLDYFMPEKVLTLDLLDEADLPPARETPMLRAASGQKLLLFCCYAAPQGNASLGA